MHRRAFLIVATAATAAGFGGGVRAEVPLDRISAYFNSITTLQADFVQTNPDGKQQSGTLYMRRPGRARFEYDGDDTLVMAGGGQVAVFDGRSNQSRPEQYPLKKTPLWVVLEGRVDLARRNMIVGHSGDARTTTVVAQDPDAPQNGRVELYFFNDPLTLAGWTTIDGQGARTRVQLEKIRLGGNLSNRLFNIVQETQSRSR